MFFGVFETLQRFGKQWTSRYWNYPFVTSQSRPNRPRSLAMADGLVVILAGATGGCAFQSISYPLMKLRLETKHIQNNQLEKSRYRIGFSLLQKRGLFHYYRGISSQLIRAMPPSAIGLFVYEMSSEWVAKMDQMS
jgi:hypothetical protein